MKMSKVVLAIAMGVGFAPLAIAGAGAGLAGGHHDFTAGSGHTAYVTGSAVGPDPGGIADVGLCTFCHTPHKASSTKLLWNHTLSGNTFSWTDAKTTAGTPLPDFVGATWQGSSAKCLSCHDGTVAIGDVALFIEQSHNAGNELISAKMGDVDSGFVITSPTGSMDGNHPVAVPYPYQQARNTYNGVKTGAYATLTEWQANPSGVRLYSDDGAGNISSGPKAKKSGIECSSCHDPHDKKSVDDLFLLGNLAGSDSQYLCLKCHIK